jgi:flavin reductase (DIM6/NTAB) family NADH-FMN oxidoreductase RutF
VTFNSTKFRSVMGRFATGVTLITYLADGEVGGMTANAFMSVSLDPPLVLISVRRQGTFVKSVQKGDRYGVSFLSHDQEMISRHFGGKAQEGFQLEFETFNDFPVIADAVGNLVAVTRDVHEAGDHLLYVGEVEHFRYYEDGRPLLFFAGNYHLIEG